jgi:recombinational DNA repair ATPase RecF
MPSIQTNSNPNIRLARLDLENFRGILGSLDLNFVGKSSEPESVVVSGDNGFGKSSIVDAIEWCCQGANRKGTVGSSPENIIHLKESKTSVRVTLQNSDVIERTLSKKYGLFDKTFSGDNTYFRRAPMILKRNDILGLLESKPAERGLVFTHLRLVSQTEIKLGNNNIVETDKEVLDLKNALRAKNQSLTSRLGVTIKSGDQAEIDAIIKTHVFQGLSRREAKRKIQISQSLLADVKELEQIRAMLLEAKKRRDNSKREQVDEKKGIARDISLLAELLAHLDDWMTTSFKRITKAPHVKSLAVIFARSSSISIDFEVELEGGILADPVKVFSEGYQDLISLLFFLASLREAAKLGQARVLILDDVFQSVDANIRVAVLELIVEEFSDWQLFITVHDNLWKSQVLDILRRAKHRFLEIDLTSWDFNAGPMLENNTPDITSSLKSILAGSDTAAISALSGRLLEQISDRLSWTFRTSVRRTWGDRYTLADTWPGVSTKLSRSSAKQTLKDLERWKHLRNLKGAHHNEWAEALSLSEARSFADSVLNLTNEVFCPKCRSWIAGNDATGYKCACGNIKVSIITSRP